jgi:hypothetical protein
MSLDKAVKHGKDHRRPFQGSARFDRSCRVGGSCEWCRRNRTVGFRRLLQRDPSTSGTDVDEGR